MTEKEGIEKADYFIKSNSEINDDKLVETIRQMIIQVAVSHNASSDLSKRYIEYCGKIK